MSRKQAEPATRPENKPEATFRKEQLLAAKRFAPQQKDILSAVLAENQTYTINAAKRLIEDFGKRTVK